MSTELTHSQMQIWVGQQLHEHCPLYNMAFSFVFQEEFATDLFRQAWQRVVEASDALRSGIGEATRGAQPIHEALPPAMEVLDFGQQADAEGEFRRWCQERCAQPLPLTGPLVESVLVGLGNGRTGWYLNQHHLVADAWSTRLFYRQVAAEYEALLQGDHGQRPPALSPYYPTAAALQRRAQQAKPTLLASAREHWAKRQEHPSSLSFYGRSAKPVGTASTRLTFEIGAARSRALDQLARQPGFLSLSEELSRFALFATLLLSWLHRISGSRTLGFDAPVAGRPTPEAKKALGLFIELFPFAAAIEPHDTFRSLGARCLAEAKLFLRHALPTTSSPSSTTAGNVVLNYFPAAFGTFAGLPPTVEWIHSGHGDSVHALRLQVHDFAGTGRYTLHFDFNEEALPGRLRHRALEHFEKVLDALLKDSDGEIASLDLLVNAERQALASLNATDSAPRPDRTVVEMFATQAHLTPQRVALRQGPLEISFADLLQQVEALAAHLVERGVAPGDRVAILGRRSTHAVLAILAALRARAAYVPLAPHHPPARLAQILQDSGARLVLVGDGAESLTEPLAALPGIDVVSVAEGIRSAAGGLLTLPGPDLGDLAYLLYTSGSTGRPKGILIEHGGLASYLQWANRLYVRGDQLTFPLFTSLAFDLTVTSLFLPLLSGGTLEIYPEPAGPVDTALMDVARANRVDFIKLTPSHLSLLTRSGLGGSRLRRMVVGGENLTTHLAANTCAKLPDLELYNEYGPTEAVVGCVAQRYQPSADQGASVPIGAPADHVQIEILNQSLAPVPEGVAGELWISRDGLARGYHGLKALTAERFLPHPTQARKRRYRTGDRVRLVDAGKLEYLGRLDRQLKVSGFRVEPAEIEAALRSLPQIEHCAVVAHRRPAAQPQAGSEVHHCTRCGLPSNAPRAEFDSEGVCSVCHSYESIKGHAQTYFKTMDDLRALFETPARGKTSEYDCLMLYSGGKDSSYALCRLVEMGLKVYAFTLDNGFIAEGAKDNIRKVTQQLGVPVEFATTPAMNAIFRDSLRRFSNVCNGCFKTIYTLSMQRARELGIPRIVTGLSRGQMFETRLTEEMFRDGRRDPQEIDAAVLAARKVYHRADDEVARSLDVRLFAEDRIFEEIQFVDFYRYCDVSLDEVYSYLGRKIPWVRPQDTGRSTNCLINDLGIYIHKKERGHHNYALPYSWDVRLGHKTRQEALDELDDHIDADYVQKTLVKIEYAEELQSAEVDQATLTAYYVSSADLTAQELRQGLSEHLPPQLIPTSLHQVESIPLTTRGKVDEKALLSRQSGQEFNHPQAPYRPPEGPVEEYLVDLWQEELAIDRVGADDNFFTLGGTSLAAMQVMLRLCREFELELPLDGMFSHPTLCGLARVAEDRILADVEEMAG